MADKNGKPALSISGLRKSFGAGEARVDVINGIDFSVPEGRFEAIMGPSGSGKSTLLHLAAGLLEPDAGVIEVGGVGITGKSDKEITLFRRRHIGLIFQDFNLMPTLTAEENIELPLLLDNRRDSNKGRIEMLMRQLGIYERRRHIPSKLSGGERQRVAIARALAGTPDIVLADEPTGNLDSPAAKDFCELLARVNRELGCAMIMVTHDPVVAAAADTVHLIRDGVMAGRFDTGNDPKLVSERYLEVMAEGGSK